MFSKRKFDLFLIFLFLVFSYWLMHKSFGYLDNGNYYIARHQIGDFGLHLSLIRSFSWGENFPPVLPFFPGEPLVYHYYFDLLVGFFEKLGMRIDIAFNGLSIMAFTLLLYLIYKLPQKIFGENVLLGIISVMLFLFHSSMTFIDFFKAKTISLSLVSDIWRLPDYVHKGPFDGSMISLFFTLNVFLNQRHLITGLVIALGIFYILLPKLLKKIPIGSGQLVVIGLLLGISSRVHSFAFLSCAITLFLLFVFFKRYKEILYLFIPLVFVFSFHLRDIVQQQATHLWFNPGFLVERPLSLSVFLRFWFLNLGLAFFLIPLAFLVINKNQKKVFFSLLPLFIIGNLFQLSLRIDHNHTLFNFFFIFMNFYIAFFLVKLWKNQWRGKVIFCILLFFLMISGIIDLMPIKNDFRYPVQLGSEYQFLEWLKTQTRPNAVFLSRQEILDPVTLAGRKNYLGHSYYREVMGYDASQREKLVTRFFEADEISDFDLMRKEKISYIVLPKDSVVDFPYKIDRSFFVKHLPIKYEDEKFIVVEL